MQTSEQINELAAALAKATLEFKPILRNKTVQVRMKTGGSYTFAYAPMETILEATKPALAKHGISALQNLRDGCLVTLLVHSSGQFMELAPVHIPQTDGSPQALGSILTYCSRYSYKTALNLATDDDDDGRAAAGNETQTIKSPDVPRINPVRDSAVELPDEVMAVLRELAAELVEMVESKGSPAEAYKRMTSENLDSDQKVALWSILGPNSKTRTALKKAADEAKVKAAA